jgi:thioredoxin reductase (NADPH)
MSEIHNVVIIGSGPAGLTAAIYAARGNLKPVVVGGYMWGGQLMTTTEVENFPGFAEGIKGPDLMDNMTRQAERFGAKLVYQDVLSVDFTKTPYVVDTGSEQFLAKTVIVATGAKSRMLGVSGEQQFWSKGVSTCATCDGAFFRNKTVAVVGGGDSAMEEATYLTNFADKVYLIHRRADFRASKIMIERAQANPKIEMKLNTTVTAVEGTDVLTNLKLQDTVSGAVSDLAADGLFLAIGHIPATEVVKGKLTIDELGYLVAEEHSMSNIPGVFIAGDVHDHRYRQAITAAGEGCKAAIDAQRWLELEHA